MSENIDWSSALSLPKGKVVNLKESTEIDGSEIAVHITALTQTSNGNIVATVVTNPDIGDTLWLSGDNGAQNGLFSLVKAAGGEPDFLNKHFVYTRVSSDNSPAGYAHRWTLSEE